jgi:hypothetical protein
MAELSPAAQAVLSAYHEEAMDYIEEWGSFRHKRGMAAALQAVADQVVPEEPAPNGMRPAGEVYSAREIKRRQRQDVRSELLAIAAELEAQ